MGKEDNLAEENRKANAVELVAARASTLNNSQGAHYGFGELDGNVSKVQAQITEGINSEDNQIW